MSGEGPESIPTSADPRSKRPTKKRALTPTTAQAATVNALFSKPEQEIRIPRPGPSRPSVAAPPEIVTNVQGSSAGAGSGEFHVYKAARRREYERLRTMEEQLRAEKAAEGFERAKREHEARDEEKTRKNREKREKKRAKQKLKQRQNGGGAGGGDGQGGADKGHANNHDTNGQAPGGGEGRIAPRRDVGAFEGGDAGDRDGSGAARATNRQGTAGTVPSELQSQGLVIHEED
ncbi:hypothetical protein SODALDRAFT_350524 [Sodiomyces alkalinus F11]|uniref:DUF1168-domain-containing protein n=1 Tax=Sodiomyces alkalinus (strain CBS 110278 / VKM F-3762 / F11) TaxID=1314773 RepID=A0A3N2PY27_SODAK|nr:hypothetical protein SODALDRAFT_350524 [Sodiomyces alkalinus F11]ROT39368.1 hypothetical protein SODALDRAFT_350524 [Sodiomyces alkalinus F11]